MASIIYTNNLQTESANLTIPMYSLVGRVAQRVTRKFPGGLFNPGNVYREIPGSMINFTPMYDNSWIVYTLMCPLGHRGAAHSISHWIFQVNGQEFGRHNRSVDHQESGTYQTWYVFSWGKGRAGTLGYLARQYSDGNHSVHFNGRRYIDGVDSSRGVPSLVTVEEQMNTVY